mgnify:CR=1 FL=1
MIFFSPFFFSFFFFFFFFFFSLLFDDVVVFFFLAFFFFYLHKKREDKNQPIFMLQFVYTCTRMYNTINVLVNKEKTSNSYTHQCTTFCIKLPPRRKTQNVRRACIYILNNPLQPLLRSSFRIRPLKHVQRGRGEQSGAKLFTPFASLVGGRSPTMDSLRHSKV